MSSVHQNERIQFAVHTHTRTAYKSTQIHPNESPSQTIINCVSFFLSRCRRRRRRFTPVFHLAFIPKYTHSQIGRSLINMSSLKQKPSSHLSSENDWNLMKVKRLDMEFRSMINTKIINENPKVIHQNSVCVIKT